LGSTGGVKAENGWAYCNKCGAFFWNGYDDKGDCATGGEHRSNGAEYFAIETKDVSHDPGSHPIPWPGPNPDHTPRPPRPVIIQLPTSREITIAGKID